MTLTIKTTYYRPLVLYNTIDSDVALAYLPPPPFMIAVKGMIMSMVIVHENKKLILRPLNIVHRVEFTENGKAWKVTLRYTQELANDIQVIFITRLHL